MINKVLLFPYIYIFDYEEGNIRLWGVVMVKNGRKNQKITCCRFEMIDKFVLGKW